MAISDFNLMNLTYVNFSVFPLLRKANVSRQISPSEVNEAKAYGTRYTVKPAAKRRWWPWMLLLLLPTLGYGCK